MMGTKAITWKSSAQTTALMVEVEVAEVAAAAAVINQ